MGGFSVLDLCVHVVVVEVVFVPCGLGVYFDVMDYSSMFTMIVCRQCLCVVFDYVCCISIYKCCLGLRYGLELCCCVGCWVIWIGCG